MGQAGQRGGAGRRAGGERQVGPAAQEGRARGAGPAVLGRCELGLGRSVGAGWLRRWAGADRAGLGRKEVGRGFGLLGWFFWVPFLFYFFSFPLNSKLFEFK